MVSSRRILLLSTLLLPQGLWEIAEDLNQIWNAPGLGSWEFQQKMLWTQDGPYYKDARQNRLEDCWLPATLAAIAWVSPDWIAHQLYFDDGQAMYGHWFPDTERATMTIFNSSTGWAQNFTVNIWNESPTEDRPGKAWWPSAATQAIRQMAMTAFPTPDIEVKVNYPGFWNNGSIVHNDGTPATVMAMMTGMPITIKTNTQYTSEEDFWNEISQAWKTPIVFTTLEDEKLKVTKPDTIKGYHAYAVLYTTDYKNGTRTVTTRNPWGYTNEMDIPGVYASFYYVTRLTGFKELRWGAKE